MIANSSAAILNRMVKYTTDPGLAFSALADPTRRGILERLGRSDASISDLAAEFDMTLTGMGKHVRILEESALVRTEKVGRVRTCRLGPYRLEEEVEWMVAYQRMLEARYRRLDVFLERTEGEEP